jgi:3-oxoacyl-[acyl-carrier protein] reductase
MSKLTEKVAIVTGASEGIGSTIATSLAAEGASLIVNYASSKAGADAVVSAITSAGGKAVAVRGDVSKATDAQGLIDAAIKNFGRLDILVNNSGVYESSPIESFTEEQFHKVFNINVLGLFSPRRPHFPTSAKAPASSTSVLSSAACRRTALSTPVPKAQWMLSSGSRKGLGVRKIRVDSINPGWLRPKACTLRASSIPTSRRG